MIELLTSSPLAPPLWPGCWRPSWPGLSHWNTCKAFGSGFSQVDFGSPSTSRWENPLRRAKLCLWLSAGFHRLQWPTVSFLVSGIWFWAMDLRKLYWPLGQDVPGSWLGWSGALVCSRMPRNKDWFGETIAILFRFWRKTKMITHIKIDGFKSFRNFEIESLKG